MNAKFLTTALLLGAMATAAVVGHPHSPKPGANYVVRRLFTCRCPKGCRAVLKTESFSRPMTPCTLGYSTYRKQPPSSLGSLSGAWMDTVHVCTTVLTMKHGAKSFVNGDVRSMTINGLGAPADFVSDGIGVFNVPCVPKGK